MKHANGNNARFARAIGVKPTTFQTYISQGRLPNSETLAAIHNTFGVDLNWLCAGVGTPDGPDPILPPIENDRLFKILEAVQTKCVCMDITLSPRALAAVVAGIYRLHEEDDYPPERLVGATIEMVFYSGAGF